LNNRQIWGRKLSVWFWRATLDNLPFRIRPLKRSVNEAASNAQQQQLSALSLSKPWPTSATWRRLVTPAPFRGAHVPGHDGPASAAE